MFLKMSTYLEYLEGEVLFPNKVMNKLGDWVPPDSSWDGCRLSVRGTTPQITQKSRQHSRKYSSLIFRKQNTKGSSSDHYWLLEYFLWVWYFKQKHQMSIKDISNKVILVFTINLYITYFICVNIHIHTYKCMHTIFSSTENEIIFHCFWNICQI
jgi:hypothetical protein